METDLESETGADCRRRHCADHPAFGIPVPRLDCALRKWYDRFRFAFLTFTLFYIGWYAQAQLSVVNTLTLFSAILTEFHWEFFLMDPIVFILWLFTAATMLLWNRGRFAVGCVRSAHYRN